MSQEALAYKSDVSVATIRRLDQCPEDLRVVRDRSDVVQAAVR
jgi:hypothetical protein